MREISEIKQYVKIIGVKNNSRFEFKHFKSSEKFFP